MRSTRPVRRGPASDIRLSAHGVGGGSRRARGKMGQATVSYAPSLGTPKPVPIFGRAGHHFREAYTLRMACFPAVAAARG